MKLFYLEDSAFLMPPCDWASNIVAGKAYNATFGEGLHLYEQVISVIRSEKAALFPFSGAIADDSPRFGEERSITPRLGQGGFRVLVMDEYERRCAITTHYMVKNSDLFRKIDLIAQPRNSFSGIKTIVF